MKQLLSIFVILLVIALPTYTKADQQAVAESQLFGGEPLMIIRFNQPNVYYQLPLYKAVKRAIDIYPNASFQVLSVIPTTGDFKTDDKSAGEASEYANLITTALTDMGLPRARFRTNYTSDSTQSYHEVRLYVR